MRRNHALILFLILLLASCTPQRAPAAASTSAPATATHFVHAPEIRFALIGEPRDVNVWELFDRSGASYADYALRAEYWPRLYHLAPPELNFQPLAAEGPPSGVTEDGGMYSATVKLRTDLKWTDGSAFTAEDVVFTVNTALAFELGFDWSASYPRDYVDRVEVMDAATAKFFFKQEPNVGVWQYAVLQGPIVQRAYWEPLIQQALTLLPDDALHVQITDAQTHFAETQAAVDDLTAQITALKLDGKQDRKLEGVLATRQNELAFARNNLDKLLDEAEAKVRSAHQALYALDDTDEPTLGTWIPMGKQDGGWVNQVNPDLPFAQPIFDRAVYRSFSNERDAEQALNKNEVDMILRLDGGLPVQKPVDSQLAANLDGRAHFLIFNPANSALADPAVRQAFACLLWFPSRSSSSPLNGFVLQGNDFWHDPEAVTPCSDLTDANIEDLRWPRIVQILGSAGYSWEVEPTKEAPGAGFVGPNGQPVPSLKLLGLSEGENTAEATTASFIADSAQKLGISTTIEYGSPQDIRYEVFSSKQYDMAILGWNLSLYPGYLCQWFGPQGQFDYGSDKLKAECEALEIEPDLDAARKHVFEIQSILVDDLPFIPLYAGVTHDAYRNIHYPYESVLGGLGRLYGAPSDAMP